MRIEIVINQGSRAQSAQVIENARLYEKEKQLLKVFSQCLNESAKLKEKSSDRSILGMCHCCKKNLAF